MPLFQVEYRDRSKDLLKRRCRIVNADISEDEIETMLDEGKTQMFNASILEDTTKAREQLNELKGKITKCTEAYSDFVGNLVYFYIHLLLIFKLMYIIK